MNRWVLLSASCVLLNAFPVRAADVGPPTKRFGGGAGVLVLAHGGSDRWNRLVEETIQEAQLAYPTEIAFGMGMQAHEVERLQRAVDQLQQQGVDQIVAVPLLVSSSSQVIRQFQYLLGLRDHGPWEAQVQPVALSVSVVMTSPLDDDPVVAEILLERALDLSRVPEEEAVILVAHGPTANDDNAQWLDVMGRVASWIKAEGRFREVVPVTMRDDAPPSVKEEAIRQMREVVRQHSLEGRTIVVPLLVASGGIETKIPERLDGLQYVYRGTTLLPHPKMAQWIVQRVEEAVRTMKHDLVREEEETHGDVLWFSPAASFEQEGGDQGAQRPIRGGNRVSPSYGAPL